VIVVVLLLAAEFFGVISIPLQASNWRETKPIREILHLLLLSSFFFFFHSNHNQRFTKP
jgi:hypothetical protein